MKVESDRQKWDARYAEAGYEPDREPTGFVVEATAGLRPGQALCLAAGAGRNAVHLAAAGWRVTAVDISVKGLAWCRRLAQERGVHVETVTADLRTWDLGQAAWDLVTMVSYLDEGRFADVRLAVRPGGRFLLHTFATGQAGLGWGPRSAEHLADPDRVRGAFDGWQSERFEHGVFERLDSRREAVVRMLVRRP